MTESARAIPAAAAPNPGVVPLAEQFDTREQARDTYRLGMWVFLATEVLFFGGLIAAYSAYRLTWPRDFALASHHTVYWIGTLNTGILLTSSLFMALAVHNAREGRRGLLVLFLCITLVFGVAFMGLKGLEYYKDYSDHLFPWYGWAAPVKDIASARHVKIFWILYFFLTGLHAIHLTIGICVVATVAFLAWRGRFTALHYTPVELTGLYWHFIDIVWVFLYPLIYLIGHR